MDIEWAIMGQQLLALNQHPELGLPLTMMPLRLLGIMRFVHLVLLLGQLVLHLDPQLGLNPVDMLLARDPLPHLVH